MSPRSIEYTLVGFSPELDWRKVSFVNPIPANRICCACGVVRKRTVLLPCVHVLCDCCFEQCAQGDLYVCPLDGYQCHDKNDVDWKEFPAEQLLKREVRCWNDYCGCEKLTTASDISHHFQLECEHHSVSCPRCSAVVLYRDLFSHLRSDCSIKEDALQSEKRGACCCRTDEGINSLRASLENQAAEIRLFLERLVAESATRGDQLNEVSHRINTLTETLKQEVGPETPPSRDILSRCVRDAAESSEEVRTCLAALTNTVNTLPGRMDAIEIKLEGLKKETSATRDNFSKIAPTLKCGVRQNSKTVGEKIREILAHSKHQPAFLIFSVTDVKSLEDKARKEGKVDFFTDVSVYLRGYCILPGITLLKRDNSVFCIAALAVCKGDLDDFVEWPFSHSIKLSVIHPKGGKTLGGEMKVRPNLEFYQKPLDAENSRVSIDHNPFDLMELINDGYIENDTLRVKWEVLPNRST